jgi:membrane-associated phospholipid phosphatase
MAISMCALLWLDLAASKQKPNWMKILTFVFALGFALSIAYSRIILGVHSFN